MSLRVSPSEPLPQAEGRRPDMAPDSTARCALNVGIVNAFGANRGDEAMLRALVHFLRDSFTGVEITIYAKGQFDFSPEQLHVVDWPHADVPGRRWSYRLGRAAEKWLLAKPSRLPPRTTGLMEHDFILSAPAGPYFGDLNRRSNFAALLPLAVAQTRGIPFGIVGTSAGPFSNERWNRHRRTVLSHAQFWSIREPISMSHVESLDLGIDVVSAADLVFGHPARALEDLADSGDANLHREREHFEQLAKSGPIIAVTLNKTGYLKSDGSKEIFDADEYVLRARRLLGHVLTKTGGHVVLFPHFYGEDRTEQRLLTAVSTHLARDKGRVSVLHPYLNCEAQQALYGLADFAVSHRYHPTIFAINAGCPFLCIRHQFKTDGMLGLFDDPGPVVRTDDTTGRWIEAFDEAWMNRESIRTQLCDRLPHVQRLSQANYDAVTTHLQRCPGNRCPG